MSFCALLKAYASWLISLYFLKVLAGRGLLFCFCGSFKWSI